MTKWRCKVCGYTSEGPEPPEICPVCGAPKEAFEKVEEPAKGPSSAPIAPATPGTDGKKIGLYAISYGMFVVSAKDGDRFNGQTCNTLFQVTSEPPRVAVCLNKLNLTNEFVAKSGAFSATVLSTDNMDEVRRFGFSSGRTVDKFKGQDYVLSPKLALPVIPTGAAYLECQVRPEMTTDVGTHTLFVADVVGGGALGTSSPMTYAYYRANK